MDSAERLAAYLADELPADERTALEAELARDADLRAQLEAVGRADDALDALPPTALPDGARARLDAALSSELDDVLGPAAATDGDDAEVVDLAAARAARPRWMPLAAGAAAALALVVGGLQLAGGLGAGDDSAFDAASPTADEESAGAADDGTAEQETAEPDMLDDSAAMGDGASDGEATGEPSEDAQALAVPQLVDQGRDLDAAAARRLLTEPPVLALRDETLGFDRGSRLAGDLADEFGASPDVAANLRQRTAADPDDETEAQGGPEADRRELQLGSATAADRDAVGACLDVLLADTLGIPIYAELVTYDGEPAVAVVLVTPASADAAFTGAEVWVLTTDDCEVRFFDQD